MSENDPFKIKEKVGRVKGFSGMREEGDSYFVGKFQERLSPGIDRNKIIVSFWLVILLLFIILVRLFWVQVVSGEKYSSIARGNRVRVQSVQAERGIIYDRFNKPLVKNVPKLSLYFIPADLPEEEEPRNELIFKLSQNINMEQEEIAQMFDGSESSSYSAVLVKEDLEHKEVVMLEILEDSLPGIMVKTETRRDYLEKSGLAHVLGYVGRINSNELQKYAHRNYELNAYIGKSGVEFFYEDDLRGTNGKQEIEVDAMGGPKKILNKIESQAGNSLILSIDLELQQKLTEALSKAIRNSYTEGGGVGIIMDPQSGEILAMVSLPDFDNNFFSAGISAQAYENYLSDEREPLFNRAVSGTYPPGSIFKPIVAIAALEEGLVNEQKTFLSTGGLALDRWFFPDWKYGGHGRVNVVRALAESVNTYFYYIGGGYNDFTGLGVARITDYARKFNLGEKLRVDLPGEASGFLPSKQWKEEKKQENWYIGDTYHLAIGQGDILVSPLQAVSYMGAIANGGTLYRPHFIKDMVDSKAGSVITDVPDYIIDEGFVDQKNIEIVRKGLRQAVLSGSAKSLAYLPVSAAGKTGTAQVGGDRETHAWFTGFAPYDSPRIVMVVLIENGGEGSSVAVPVFREIAEWYFSN